MIKAYSLFEGSFSVDSSKAFVPFDDQKDDPKDRPGSLFIHVHPFLIESDDGLILCDAGLGFRTENDELLIHENVKKLGYSIEDVRYVLLSHLHRDHTGGLVDFKEGTGRLAFPNAEHVVQRAEWESAYSGKSTSYDAEIFNVVQRSGNLQLVEGSGKINDEIRYELNGAHTPAHQAFHIETGGEHYFFGGDVLPEPEEIFRSFIAKYDYDGRLARDLRAQYWADGQDAGWIYLFYHSKTIAIGQGAQKEDGSYKIVDVAVKK